MQSTGTTIVYSSTTSTTMMQQILGRIVNPRVLVRKRVAQRDREPGERTLISSRQSLSPLSDRDLFFVELFFFSCRTFWTFATFLCPSVPIHLSLHTCTAFSTICANNLHRTHSTQERDDSSSFACLHSIRIYVFLAYDFSFFCRVYSRLLQAHIVYRFLYFFQRKSALYSFLCCSLTAFPHSCQGRWEQH